MLVILALCLRTLMHPNEKVAPKIILLIIVFAFMVPPSAHIILRAENKWFPFKYDCFLYVIDKQLGVSAFWVARHLTEWQKSILFQIYQSLVAVMIVWYAVNLKRRDGRPGTLLLTYVITFLAGACLYVIVPACGPRHAFGSAFPMREPDVSPVLVSLDYWPNAIPSLHVATALLFVFFAGKSPLLRFVAAVYLGGTVAATLAFEHYVIDLVVAVPFACFVTRLAEGEVWSAFGNLALVLGWLLTIRFATPELVAYPALLRVLAVTTIGFALFGMRRLPKLSCAGFKPLSIEG